MKCPICEEKLWVTETWSGFDQVLRKRQCRKCLTYFYTEEVMADVGELLEKERYKRRTIYGAQRKVNEDPAEAEGTKKTDII